MIGRSRSSGVVKIGPVVARNCARLEITCGLVCYDGGLVIGETAPACPKLSSDLDRGLIFDARWGLGLSCSLFDPEGWFASELGYWTRREMTGTGVEPS